MTRRRRPRVDHDAPVPGFMGQCRCGSGLVCRDLNDARDILVARVCDRCENSIRLRYRNEIFTDPNYWADERIEED